VLLAHSRKDVLVALLLVLPVEGMMVVDAATVVVGARVLVVDAEPLELVALVTLLEFQWMLISSNQPSSLCSKAVLLPSTAILP